MLTTTTARLGARARHGPKGTSGGIAPPCAALIRCRQIQSRTFRFARIWASCLDPESHREVFRHHRKLRYKYTETLNRRLSWDNHPYAADAKRMLKSAIRDCWRYDSRPAARHVNTDARRKTPDNPTGVRPGQNIEDAERGAMEHLLFGDRSTEKWSSVFHGLRGCVRKQHESSPGSSSVLAKGRTEVGEYTIDPITNRKVPKSSIYSTLDAGADIPASTLKRYQPQFTSFQPPAVSESHEPIFYDGPPPEAELKKYGPVKLNAPASKAAFDGQPSPVFPSEEYESNHAKPSEKTVTWHSNDGILSRTNNASVHAVENVKAWTTEPGKFGYKEPNKSTDSTTAHEQAYDDLGKYRAVVPEEEIVETPRSAPQYPDLDEYNTSGFRYLEPDGKPVVRERAEAASELNKYRPSRIDEDETRAVLEGPQTDATELRKYQPFGYNEPDGKPATINGESHEYDPQEVRQYQPFAYNEPDGKPATVTGETRGYDPHEVQQYQAFMYNEPDGKPASAEVESNEYDPREVRQYEAFMYNEPDGKPPVAVVEGNDYDPREVQSYAAFRHNEPDGKPRSAEDAKSYDTAELQEYQEVSLKEPDVHDTTTGRREADADELGQYGPVKHNEPDGKAPEQTDSTVEALDEFDKKQRTGRQVPYIEPTEEEKAEDLDLLRASDIRASFNIPPSSETAEAKSQTRDSLVSSTAAHEAISDSADQEAAAAVKEARQRSRETEGQVTDQGRQHTGNYVRDFPEEFSRSWSSSFTPEELTSSASAAQPERLQPALNRQARWSPKPIWVDPYSKEPQGMETSYEEECGATLGSPIFVKEYGTVDAQPTPAADVTSQTSSSVSEAASASEPTLYKILAYDQTTKAIKVAETTSNISKTETPLTPAEVLLKLSNPAVFLPHFSPLQAQGFEIVSGGGDVLVFRKVRQSEGQPTAAPAKTPRVNPIDMTGSRRKFPDPAIGRFASPTGFVNYEMPAMQQGGDRRFASGIDVRREEPVFSGERKGEEESKGRKKASLPKRMAIGAAWVAGVSYALGVLGEYFRTGGADGLGPKGF